MTNFNHRKKILLRNLIAVADSFEMSWSIGANDFVENRYLLFFDHVDDRSDLMAEVAQELGVSPQLVDQWRAGLTQADAMGIAVNADLTSVRLYLQDWDRLIARVDSGDFAPYPLYTGLKSLPGGQTRQDIYMCHPLAAQEMFLPPIQDALARIGILNVTGLAETLTAEACIFTTIAGEGRSSFLATVRRANLDNRLVASWLSQLPTTAWAKAVQAHAKNSELLHIAGGEDAQKGTFTTLYFACAPAVLPF